MSVVEGHEVTQRDFFRALFNEVEDLIEIRYLPSKRQEFFNLSPLLDITILSEDQNCYFGVCPRREAKGTEDSVSCMVTLWADLDAKKVMASDPRIQDIESAKREILRRLKSFQYPPSIIVDSGNGYHTYWLLREPLLLQGHEEGLRAMGILKGLGAALEGDNVHDLARIMRLPGTLNLKEPQNPKLVRIIEFNPEQRYNLDDFEDYYEPVESYSGIVINDADIPEHVPKQFYELLGQDEKLRNTWEGKRPDLKDRSRSGFDMALASQAAQYGFSAEEIAGILKETPSGRAEDGTTQYRRRTIAKAITSGKNSKREGEKDRQVETSFQYLPDGTIIEEVYDAQGGTHPYRFAVKDLKSEDVQLSLEFRHNGTLYVPIKSAIVEKGALMLPSGVQLYESTGALLKEIRVHIHKYVEVSTLFEYLAAYYVLFTYVYDKFSELPYLRVKGDKGTGKTRFLKTVGSICYKSLTAGGALTSSPIFRFIDRWGGTLIIDEADFSKSDLYQDIIKILNCRFTRGLPVLRAEQVGGRKWQEQAYMVYGPTLLGMRGEFNDSALNSRCITEDMPKRTRSDIPLNIIDEELRKASLEIRNKLLRWRLENYSRVSLKPDLQVTGLEDRLNQIMTPILSIIDDPAVIEGLSEFMKGMNSKIIEDRGLTKESEVVRAIVELYDSSDLTLDSTKEDKFTKLSFRAIADKVNEGRAEKDHKITSQAVGYIVRDLKLKKDQASNRSFVDYSRKNVEKLKELCRHYGIDWSKPEADAQDKGADLLEKASFAPERVRHDDEKEQNAIF